MTKPSLGLSFLITVVAGSANAASFYVSPSGSPAGNGSISNPWDLATALAHPSVVRPGDTIFLRGGTYFGSFRSVLEGTSSAPIVVRRYQNERAILDGASPSSADAPMYGALTVSGDYSWFRDFEVSNTYPTRIYQRNNCFEYQHCRGHGVDVFGEGVKLINLVIHDTSDAVGLWSSAINAEVIGCIIYYVGNQTETRGHGMGIYAQNDVGTKRIVGNIIFNGFHSGIHIYGSASSSLRNVIVEGNTIFQNGTLAADPNGWGIIVGGNVVADTITVRNNYLYNPTWYYRGSNTNPSWGTYGSTRLTLTNNDSAGYRSIEYTVPPTNSTVSGNRFYGIMNDVAENNVSTTLNTVGSAQPTAPRVYFQSNAYDADRSYVTIFNGDAASAVRIYPPFLAAGDGFELRDVQNYFGPPLLTGTYTTAGINVPMSNATLSQIIGTPPRYPTPTGPAFGSFVLTRTSSAAPSAPLPLAPRVPSMSCARRNREF